MANAAIAATATKDQWDNSVDSYPERRPDFNVEQYYNRGRCIAHEHNIPYNAGGLQTESAYTGGYESLVFKEKGGDKTKAGLFYDFNCDDDECSNGTIVAIAWEGWTNEYDHGSGNTPRYDPVLSEKNYKWKCETDMEFAGWDEWVTNAALPECPDDPYKIFKDKTNIISYLYDRTISGNTLYRAIVNPSDSACVTYACAPDYFPNVDVKKVRRTSLNSDQIQCIGKEDKCPFYDDRTITGHEYLNILKTAKCDAAAYLDINGADINNSNATHGTLYIDQLRKRMNAQLAANREDARNLYNKRPNNGVFTCNDLECKLTDDVLPVESTNCDYLCTNNGFAVRLTNERDDNPCPTYFKYEYDETEKMYVCNFDEDAVNGTIAQMETDAANAAAQQRAICARSFCTASGGVYSNGNCTCGGELCNDSHRGYYYCKPSLRKHCVGGVWTGWGNRVPTPESIDMDAAGLRFDLDNCITNADNAYNSSINGSSANADSTNTTDTTASISDLAGRLALVEGQFGLSKWRTAEGKFNTARLASDLTAGVVLGTTGALVTSSVVKKKQVKDGFESLECTVGGQHVGDWGDVFRIDGK